MKKVALFATAPFKVKDEKELKSSKGHFKELANASIGGTVGAAAGAGAGGVLGSFVGATGLGAVAGGIAGGVSGAKKSINKTERQAGAKPSGYGKFFGRAAASTGMAAPGLAVLGLGAIGYGASKTSWGKNVASKVKYNKFMGKHKELAQVSTKGKSVLPVSPRRLGEAVNMTGKASRATSKSLNFAEKFMSPGIQHGKKVMLGGAALAGAGAIAGDTIARNSGRKSLTHKYLNQYR